MRSELRESWGVSWSELSGLLVAVTSVEDQWKKWSDDWGGMKAIVIPGSSV